MDRTSIFAGCVGANEKWKNGVVVVVAPITVITYLMSCGLNEARGLRPQFSRVHSKEIARQLGFDLKQPQVAVLPRVREIDGQALEDSGRFCADDQDLLREKHG